MRVSEFMEVVAFVPASTITLYSVAVMPDFYLFEGAQAVVYKPRSAPLIKGGGGDGCSIFYAKRNL